MLNELSLPVSMLIHGVGEDELAKQLGLSGPELDGHRESILRSIAPSARRAVMGASPGVALDYERPRRRWLRADAP
jgi:hypothetical protein